MNPNRCLFIVLLLLGIYASAASAQDERWPRTVTLDAGLVTLYAPQLEAMNDGVLYYRAALAYRPEADAEPIFGAGWLTSDVDINEAENIVSPRNLSLTQTRFPDGTTDIEAELATALARQSARWDLDFTVNELEAALDAAEAETLAAKKLKNTPPLIIYKDRPALLVTIDGDPVLREIEDSPYQAVINTPFPLITDGKNYYLNAAEKAWYRAKTATGPFEFDSTPPRDIVAMVESNKETTEEPADTEESTTPVTRENAPEIVVSTVPAELLVTDGPADFIPLVDDLLVLKNSADDVFLHVGEQKYFIVLAGRWYQSASLNGPWENQLADELPAAFAQIPTDSAQADSRVYVAGTSEAEEAVLDAQIPQTAAVKRGKVDIEIDYDGEPDFEPVEGTDDLYYAENTGATVLESDRVYYLLEDGVWYVSNSPHGPWVVSDHRPGELESVEPSSPVYNTKYVHVYDSTPEVVYVGYTPGYVGSYVYGPTLVYGTGYHYRPWISPRFYYPRVRTWGWNVGYSSYGGWSFGFGWNVGGWNLSYTSGGYWHYNQPWHNRYYGYWGPRGYCPTPYYGGGYGYNPYGRQYAYNRGYRRGYRDGQYDNYDYNDGHGRGRRGDRNDYYDGNGRRGGNGDERQRNRNLYRDAGQQAQVVQTRDTWVGRPNTSSRPAPGQFERSERRHVDNRKVGQSKPGPVSRTDIRNKAKVRDVNRIASREPMVASATGEVMRKEFGSSNPTRRQRNTRDQNRTDNKVRESRTSPISRNELTQRGDMVVNRSSRSNTSTSIQSRKPTVTQNSKRTSRQAVTEPARRVATTRPNQSETRKRSQTSRQQVTSPARKPVVSAPREVERRSMSTRNTRQDSSSPRRVTRPQPTTPPRVVNQTSKSRTVKPPEPRVQERTGTASVGQNRQQRTVRQQSATTVRQQNRTPARPQTRSRQNAPRPATSAPRPQVRSTPAPRPQVRQTQPAQPRVQQSRPQQRAAPASRPQKRSAPPPRQQQRSTPSRSNQSRQSAPKNKRQQR